MPGTPEAGDQFGSSLAIGHFGRSALGDLAIGIPGEAIGARGDDGLVDVLYGRSAGLESKGAQEWLQDTSGIGGSSENQRPPRCRADPLAWRQATRRIADVERPGMAVPDARARQLP